MSEITAGIFFTNLFGTAAAAGNAGTNPTDTLGTVVGISQATLGGASLIAGNIDALVKPLAGTGLFASAVGLYDNYLSIKKDLVNGQPPALSDLSGAVGDAAALVGSGLIVADVWHPHHPVSCLVSNCRGRATRRVGNRMADRC